jgi:hypothetical protein
MYFDILVPVEQKLVLSVKLNLNSSPARPCHSVPYVPLSESSAIIFRL